MKSVWLLILFITFSIVGYSQSKMSTNTSLLLMSLKHDTLSENYSKRIDKRFAVRMLGNERYVNAFIHLSDADKAYPALEELGVKVNSKFTGVITASVPVNEIESIAALDYVTYIEVGTPVHGLMDNARVAIQADDVRQGIDLPHPFLGTGVIVGVVDMGLEYGNPNFYNYDKTELRVKRVWDQQNSTGTSPEGFHYGTEFTTEDDILNAEYDTDSECHGTHVAGIAAGADTIDNGFYGIAGDADLAFVGYNGEFDGWDNISICDGIKYIFDYATSVNKPCVVNLSLGAWFGPRDGTSTFDKLTDSMQGEGRIVVAAASNEGDLPNHISKTFSSESNDSLSSFTKFSIATEGFVEIWGERGMKYTIQLFSYNIVDKKVRTYFDRIDASLEAGNEKIYSFTDRYKEGFEGEVSIVSEISPLNGKPHVTISQNFRLLIGGNYIGFTIRPITSGTVHAWVDDENGMTFTNLGINGYTSGDGKNSITEIGSGKRIVTVGAYVTRNSYTDMKGKNHNSGEIKGDIASFSSLGPTPDGRIKPEVTAPGSMVVSSISSYYDHLRSETILYKKEWNGRECYYAAKQGTSMATPCVAGTVATWLQANNNLTPEDVKSILKKTSIQDSFTGRLPEEGSNTWGYGKLNAWEGVKECLKMNPEGIESETVKPVIILSNDSNGFNLLFTQPSDHTKISVFDINGRQIYDRQINGVGSGEEIPIRLEGVSSGLYIVKVISGYYSFVSKVILK